MPSRAERRIRLAAELGVEVRQRAPESRQRRVLVDRPPMVSSSSASRPCARRSTNSASRWETTRSSSRLAGRAPASRRSAARPRSKRPSISASMVRPVPTCQCCAGWRSSSASVSSASSSASIAGAIGERPRGSAGGDRSPRTPSPCRRSAHRGNQLVPHATPSPRDMVSRALDRDPVAFDWPRRASPGPRSAGRCGAPPPQRAPGARQRVVARRRREAGEQPDPRGSSSVTDRRQGALEERHQRRVGPRARPGEPSAVSERGACELLSEAGAFGELRRLRGRPASRRLRRPPVPRRLRARATARSAPAGSSASVRAIS